MKNLFSNKFKQAILSLVALFTSVVAFAEETKEAVKPAAESTTFLTSDMLSLIVIGVMIFILIVVIFILVTLQNVLHFAKYGVEAPEEVKPLIDLTDAVPIEREHEILLDHNYDGIKELDNNLPPWWVYMFYLTIVFAAVYMYYYHFSSGPSQVEEYKNEMVVAEAQMKEAANKVNEDNVTVLTDAARIASGKEVFTQNCANCHGNAGEGKIGPNLTDKNWIHGGDIKAVFITVKNGSTTKGMPAWKTQLSPSQIQEVSSYILSLKGSNPANAKEPQGDIVVE
jgi:cytochrome c oxidase cbb3-type subunit 3